jgi:predicted secreted hydrolase
MMRSLACLVVLCLAACAPEAPAPGDPPSGVAVDQRMGATPDPGFARALQPREFSFPADHGAHEDFATEWWYFTGNLHSESGRRFGYQLTLFRIGLKAGPAAGDSPWRSQQTYMGHLAVSDVESGRHHSAERFSRAAAGLAGAQTQPLRIWLGPWSIQGTPGQTFPLRLSAGTPELGLELTLDAGAKPVVLQGDRGLSPKSAAPGNASYYYSLTRLPTRGEIRLAERRWRVEGNSWFDREWSSSALAPDQAGWDWFALQLDDGRDLMFYQMRDKQGRAQRFSRGVLVDADGDTQPLNFDAVQLSPTRTWRSDDGTSYPVAWRLRVPDRGIDLVVEAAFDEQLMRHTVTYWEGTVDVSGSHNGLGYLELSGYGR